MQAELNRRQFLAANLAAALAVVRLAAAEECASTQDNPQGPFYVAGAPFRSQLAPPEMPGDRLRIEGRVLGAPGCKPLADAVVDVWHASADGRYYGVEAASPLRPEDFVLRGRIRTGEDGRYAFDTILPGWYQVTPTWTRPRHIHYTVSHPSRGSLTTQLYFEGDPHHKTDPLVKPSLIIPLKRRGTEVTVSAYEGLFDVVLPAG